MKKLIPVLSVLTILIISCNKSDTTTTNPTPTTQEQVIGNWNHVKDVVWRKSPGNPITKDTTNQYVGEYDDYRADGKIYKTFLVSLVPPVYTHDTATYIINGNEQKISYVGNPYFTSDIQTLSSTQFVYHYVQIYRTDTIENWTYLKK